MSLNLHDSPWREEIGRLDQIILEMFPETEQRRVEWLNITGLVLPHPIPTYLIPSNAEEISERLQKLQKLLIDMGFLYLARQLTIFGRSFIELRIIPDFLVKKSRETSKERWMKFGLFVATLLSLLWVGWLNGQMYAKITGKMDTLNLVVLSLSYAVGLLLAVGVHEMGHMLLALRHGHPPNYPIFIPLPFGFGTLGAVIMQKEPFKDRNELFDISISGPLLGLIPSVIFTIIGLFLSPSIDKSLLPSPPLGTWEFLQQYQIPLFEGFSRIIKPDLSASETILLHPLALAGYIGLLVTALNLVPVGQLDGGHVARSLVKTEQQHRFITYMAALILIFLGFWFFAIIILYLYMRTGHPGPLDDVTKLTPTRQVIGALVVGLWFLLLPIPTGVLNQLSLLLQ